MAEVVTALPDKQAGHRDGENQWTKYTDGQVWKLKPNVDFHGTIQAGRSGFLGACRVRNLKGTTRFVDGFLYVQAKLPSIKKTRKSNDNPAPSV